MRAFRFLLFAGVVGVALVSVPRPAHAWRVFFGVPYSYYVPPPLYYAPPPVVYAPPAYAPRVYDPAADNAGPAVPSANGTSCDAGAYICPIDRPVAFGSPCSCPANRGRVSGTAR